MSSDFRSAAWINGTVEEIRSSTILSKSCPKVRLQDNAGIRISRQIDRLNEPIFSSGNNNVIRASFIQGPVVFNIA